MAEFKLPNRVKNIFSRWLSTTITIVLVVGLFTNWVSVAFATAYVAGTSSDVMTNGRDNTTADHTIAWQLPSGVTFDVSSNTDYLRVDFHADFAAAGTWVTGDYTLVVNCDNATCTGGSPRTLTINAVDQGAGDIDCTVAAGVDNVCVTVDTTNDIFTIKPSSSFTATTADKFFKLTIDGTTSDGTFTNPNVGSDTNYVTSLAMCDEAADCSTFGTTSHTGSFAVNIELNTNDQVVVSATVDPSLTFALSANTINLGTLTSASVSSATITVQTVTNSVGGYSTTVLENNNLQIDGSNDINDVGDGTVTAGAEPSNSFLA